MSGACNISVHIAQHINSIYVLHSNYNYVGSTGMRGAGDACESIL